ncbi:MAG TPA: right-handed parallel beta-helix repeat-containing protein, partial [Terrimesophilobacter sp.]|nr:right-handed parallel beta-helix repeat-containing protein [Terrimesophilobacter sp.]
MTHRTRTRSALSATAAISLALAGTLLVAAPASAAVFTVADETDLIIAINAANGNPDADTINLTGTGFTLSGDLPTIVYPVSIVGPGMGTFTLDAANHRAFRFDGSVNGIFDASVSGLTIEHAGVTLNDGGIHSTDTNLQISTVTVTESQRGLNVLGGSVTVTDAFFTDNVNNGVYLFLENTSDTEFLRVQSTGNGLYGFLAELHDGVSLEITDTQSNDNAQNGFLIDAYDQSTLTITDTTAELNDQYGFGLYLENDVTAFVTNSSALNNAFIGFQIWASHDVEATVVGATANDNATGFDIVVS